MRRTTLLVVILISLPWVFAPWCKLRASIDDPQEVLGTEQVFILGKDLLQLLEKDPEAVILVGEQARKYLEDAKNRSRGTTPSVLLQKCQIRGELRDDAALFTMEITARSEQPGRAPVPLGLNEANLSSVTIDGGAPFLTRDSQGWIAWVDGRGQHTIVVDLQIPISGSASLPALLCSIPEAPITSLELSSQRPVIDGRLIPTAPLTIRPGADSKTLLEAALGPRSRLDLRWRWQDEMARDTAPLVRAASQVTASVEVGGIQLKTELRIQVLRGSQQTIELQTVPQERVLDLRTADGKVVGWQSSVEGSVQRIAVHYTEPLSGTSELLISSELPWAGDSAEIRGWSVHGAYSHWSLLALRSAPELDVAVVETEQARPTESLPATMRSPRNDSTLAAYTQPYRIKLSIQPRLAQATVRSHVLITFGEDRSALAARWQFAVHGGKIAMVRFRLPPPFRVEDFIYSDTIQAIREEETAEGRFAHIFLRGTPDEFEVRLRSALSLVQARNLVKLELPWPRDSQSELSRLYLAGTPHFDLDATPNLVRVEAAPDSWLVNDLVDSSTSIRAYESRSHLERAAFRLSASLPTLRYTAQGKVRITGARAHVHQTFEFRGQPMSPRQLRFSVPETIRGTIVVDAAPGPVTSDAEAPEMVIRVDGELSEPWHVRLSYQWPLPADRDAAFLVPLVTGSNGLCDVTEIALDAPWNMHLEAAKDWQVVPRSEMGAAYETARWLLRKSGSAETVSLHVTKDLLLSGPATVVDRTWIETILGTEGQCQTRARFAISSLDSSRLALRLPQADRLTRVRWNGRVIPVYAGANADVVELVNPEPGRFPAILEVELENSAVRRMSPTSRFSWNAPVLLGDVVWGKIFWQLVMPESLAVVRGPENYGGENEMRWIDGSFRWAARYESAELSRWLHGSDLVRAAPAPGTQLLYSRLLSIEPLTITGVNRPMLVLCSSGFLMFLGMLLLVLPRRFKIPLIIAVLLASMILFAMEPLGAIEGLRSAGLGLLLVIIAGACHLMVTRRTAGRRSVFPEPGLLARSQGSSVRGAADFYLGKADDIAGAADTTNGASRMAASSSITR